MSGYFIVTGAAGFIGSNVVRALNARGERDIIAVDNLERGDKFRNLVDCEIADYFDKREFLEMLASGRFDGAVEAVLHQGACSDTVEADGRYMLGIRPHHVTPLPIDAATGELEGRVLVTELSGSESVIHLDVHGATWVSQSHGIHPFEVGTHAKLHVDIDQGLFFTPSGERVS